MMIRTLVRLHEHRSSGNKILRAGHCVFKCVAMPNPSQILALAGFAVNAPFTLRPDTDPAGMRHFSGLSDAGLPWNARMR
jgi:hypothetical protein